MRRIRLNRLTCLTLVMAMVAVALSVVVAAATPEVNSVVIRERIFNDCPTSVLTTMNDYPTELWIDDAVLDCGGFANLHNWRFSEDGIDPAVFNNDAAFRFSTDPVIDGTADGEGGLQVSPWWSQDVDGRLNIRTTDGEIACFGGRLPFFSFTGTFSINYVKGETIFVEITYLPNELTEADPATIEYRLIWMGTEYTSGPLAFDEGNPGEMMGTWGMLDDGRVGGHIQPFLQAGNPDAQLRATWSNFEFEDLSDPTPTEETTLGTIKALYR
jgi:hypothetical protein